MPRTKPIKPGKLFMLTIIGPAGSLSSSGCVLYSCVCECGNKIEVSSSQLRRGKKKSCGCAFKRMVGEATRKHGKSRSAEHRVWCGMHTRCNNKNERAFKDYGGRGITVCDRWSGEHGFENFLADMGRRPSKFHEIDRRNNDLGYSPDNCRWATRVLNGRNKRNNIRFRFRGEERCMTEWCELLNLNEETVKQRHYLGWMPERILTTPTTKPFTKKYRSEAEVARIELGLKGGPKTRRQA